MDLIEKIEERLSIFKNMYDSIRIVDPVKKMVILDRDENDEAVNINANHTCYALWKKHTICQNCISMRAYVNNDTFVKVEYDKEQVNLIIAAPVEMNGKVFIAEIIKDISKKGSVIERIDNGSCFAGEFINCMNVSTVKDNLTGIYNKNYINERLPIDLNYSKINNLPLSIIMTKLDFSEDVVEKYGQAAEEMALVIYTNLIKNSIRSNLDWIGRYSSRQFLIVLNDTDISGANIVAEKIKKQLETTKFNYKDNCINVKSSFGVYGVTDYYIDASDLLTEVEKTFYKSANSSTNMIFDNKEKASDFNYKGNIEKADRLTKLNKQIGDLREVLNEVCYTLEEDRNNSKTLIISQCLDELIVSYMKEINSLS